MLDFENHSNLEMLRNCLVLIQELENEQEAMIKFTIKFYVKAITDTPQYDHGCSTSIQIQF